MGRTGKSNKRSLNPTDAHRKAMRKKEIKKNKRTRQQVRQNSLLRRDPEKIKQELTKLEQLEQMGAIDKRGKQRRRQLEANYEQVAQARPDVAPLSKVKASVSLRADRFQGVGLPTPGARLQLQQQDQPMRDAEKPPSDGFSISQIPLPTEPKPFEEEIPLPPGPPPPKPVAQPVYHAVPTMGYGAPPGAVPYVPPAAPVAAAPAAAPAPAPATATATAPAPATATATADKGARPATGGQAPAPAPKLKGLSMVPASLRVKRQGAPARKPVAKRAAVARPMKKADGMKKGDSYDSFMAEMEHAGLI